MKEKLVLSIFFFLLFSLSFAKAQEYYISDCSILDQENTIYYLTQDIIDSTNSTCMNIRANNIVLDCQGHTIDGIDQSSTYGISVHRSSLETTNITIKNCVVSDWNEGIHLYYAGSNILTNITVNSNYYGIYLYFSNSNTIKNSRFQDNNYGIYLTYSVETNLIYNNLFNNTNNFYIGKAIACNWNTSYQEGENIWNTSLGYIAGNAWFKPDGTGYSETSSCHDSNADGFCDDPYVLATNNIDYLPIAKTIGQYPTISSCSILDQENTTYYLTQDIIDQNVSACINIIASGITIDCQNHLIDGVDFYVPPPDEQMSFGIVSNGYSNIAIRNCRLSDWSHPLSLLNGENISVENIEAFSGVWIGAFVENSNNVYLSNITVHDFAQDSFIFRNTINSRLENAVIYNGGHHGIAIDGNSNNISLENIEVFNTSDIGINVNGDNHVLRNLTVHSTQGIWVWGNNHLLENIETFDTTAERAGVEIYSDNTVLRNIYNHDEYRSVLGGTNNTLEYSRCENIILGCWHIFGNNITVRHNNFPSGMSLFGSSYDEIYNNTIDKFTIRDWENKPSSFIKIYNNTIYSYLSNYFENYRSDSIEIYGNYFYGIVGVFDTGGINTSVHNNFFNISWAIAFYNGATNSHVFSNEIHSTNAFYFSGTKNIVINDNIIEANTLAYYDGNAENIISCNNTIIAFNKSWDYNPDYNISLLNVMRIESDSCEPYVNIISAEPVNFGDVKVGEESNATVPITIKSNMINVSILVRGDSDFPDFPISSVRFLADKDKPYPVEEMQLEKGITKATSIFLPGLASTFYSLWKISVPSGIAAGYKQASATMFASIPQASDSRQLTLSLNVISEIPPPTPPPRLYQLSPIAGILAYVLLPIVFALVAQKYLLGEVELTLQGLIKYLIMFVMVIIIAVGFALVFSII